MSFTVVGCIGLALSIIYAIIKLWPSKADTSAAQQVTDTQVTTANNALEKRDAVPEPSVDATSSQLHKHDF